MPMRVSKHVFFRRGTLRDGARSKLPAPPQGEGDGMMAAEENGDAKAKPHAEEHTLRCASRSMSFSGRAPFETARAASCPRLLRVRVVCER